MSRTNRLADLSPYAERLLDDYIYDQLDDAGSNLRAAYDRVNGRPARRAIDDRQLVGLLRGATGSIRRAALAAAGRDPEPSSRTPRIVLALAAAVATAALVRWLARAPESRETDYRPAARESVRSASQAGVPERQPT